MAEKYSPVRPGTVVTEYFAPPRRTNHKGWDFGLPLGAPVYSASDGTIAHVGVNDDPKGYGSWLVVDSQAQWGLDFTYGHMPPSSFINPRTGETWKYGDEVRAGDIIATVGSEGGSTGPHLHFETSGPPGRFGGQWLDPKAWMDGARDPLSAPQYTSPAPITPAPDPTPAPPSSGDYVGKELLDYSAGIPSAAEVFNAGFVGAVRYTSPARPDAKWMLGKPLGKAEADDFRSNGLFVVSNYQFAQGGNETSDWLRGREGGLADVEIGLRHHRDAGGPDNAPIYVSVDANPGDDNLRNKVLPYLQAWQEKLGRGRMGVYGNRQTIEFCIQNGIGAYFWQHGWDGRKKGTPIDVHPEAHILQYAIDVRGVLSIGVDKNRILKNNFGAWGQAGGVTYNPPTAPAPPKETGVTVKSPGGYPTVKYWDTTPAPHPGWSRGFVKRLRIYVHTTENQDWTTKAENVAAYQARQQDGSYHDLIDDTHILQTVPYEHTAWGVLSDNTRSIQIALVGTSGTIGKWSGQNPNVESRPKTREQWLEHELMLDMLAFKIAEHAQREGIPIERVDIVGIGQNRMVVSSHNNFTFGSKALIGRKDGTHWDVPDTFPFDVVLNAAKGYAGQPSTPATPPDPDRFPLTPPQRWGPLDGPAEDISNIFGSESQASRDGLKRWQEAIGLVGTGVYDSATRAAALKMQQILGWPTTMADGTPNGRVWEGEWNMVIRHGWRFPTEEVKLPEIAPVNPVLRPINPGPKVSRSKKIRDVTGPGTSAERFGVGGTDLGVMTRTPKGRILAIFGDTFREMKVGGPEWRAPVGLYSDTTDLDNGIEWHEAAGGDPNYARQLWDYPHDNPVFSTVLPTDIITIGSRMYLHVMVNKGLGNVVWTELARTDDDGKSWKSAVVKFPADLHGGLFQMWTMTLAPDGFVYIFSTGFQRNKPMILSRVPHDRMEDLRAYETWGFRAETGWKWGNPPTPVLDNANSAGKFGEMSLRYMQGQFVLVNFDVSNVGGYDIDVRVFKNITDNLYEAKKSTPVRGTSWGMEGDDAVAQLYGPSVVPGSTFDGGFHIFLSQWNTAAANGWPYRSMQFKIPVDPIVPPLKGEIAPTPQPEPASEPQPVETAPAQPAPTHTPAPSPAPQPTTPPYKPLQSDPVSFWSILGKILAGLVGRKK